MLTTEGLDCLLKAIKDPTKRKIIAKDPAIIGGLVLVLSNNDTKVTIEALNVLLSLATPPEDREFLREFLGMVDQLTTLSSDTNPLDHVRELSSQLLSRLNSDQPVPVPSQPNVVHNLKQRDTNIQTSSQRSSRAFNKPFLNAAKFKTIILQIDGLNDKADMEICRDRLLTVKGVVSITFDLNKHRSILRVKPEITPQILALAIHQSNVLVASQVIRTESGDEQVIELNTSDTVENKENTILPSYLSDDDSPVKVDDKAVRRFGYQEDRGAGSWLGAAASFLAKSFYW